MTINKVLELFFHLYAFIMSIIFLMIAHGFYQMPFVLALKSFLTVIFLQISIFIFLLFFHIIQNIFVKMYKTILLWFHKVFNILAKLSYIIQMVAYKILNCLKRIHENNRIVIQRSFVYFELLFISFIIIFFVFKIYNVSTTTSSGLYMISALVQSEAAIIAIVITLSLVAIQHLSSTYSTRVIEVFKDWKSNPDFYIMLLTYVVSILFGLLIIKQIEVAGSTSHYVSDRIETQLRIAYGIGFFCFFSLFIYINQTLKLFNPNLILKLLFQKIDHPDTVENAYKDIKNNIKNKNTLFSSKKPIHAILDILKSSARNSDFETTKSGLSLLEEKSENIINNKQIENHKKELYLTDIFEDIEYIGILATKTGSEEVTKLICNLLGENGKYSIDSNTKILTLSSLEKIGCLAAKNNMNEAIDVVLDYFGYYIHKYDEYELESDNGILDLTDISYSYANIGNESAEQKMKGACMRISSSFFKIEQLSLKNDDDDYTNDLIQPFVKYGNLLIDNKLDEATFTLISKLELVTNIALRNDHNDVVFETVSMINNLAEKSSADSNMFSSTILSVKVLEKIGMSIFDYNIKDYKPLLSTIIKSIQSSEINMKTHEKMVSRSGFDISIRALENIGNKCIHNELKQEAFNSVYALSNIGINILNFDLNWIDNSNLENILLSMYSISETSIKKGEYSITRTIAFRIYNIGEKASIIGRDNITNEAINHLYEIYSSLIQDSTEYTSSDWGELKHDKNNKLKSEILKQIENLKQKVYSNS